MTRRKYLISPVYGGLGDQLFKYFSGVYLSENQNRILVNDFSNLKNTHVGNPDGILRLIGSVDYAGIQAPTFAVAKFTFYKRVLGRISSNKKLNYSWVKRIISFIFGVLSDTKEDYSLLSTKNIKFQYKLLKFHKYIYLTGYFSDFAYFDGLSSEAKRLPGLEKLRTEYLGGEAISHFRNGDTFETYTDIGVLSTSYYEAAIQYLRNIEFDGKILGVSDNVSRAIMLHQLDEVEMIPDSDCWDAINVLARISTAKFRICANSGLSLWAAKLANDSDSVTIIPATMKKRGSYSQTGSIPSNWIRIENSFISTGGFEP